MRIMSFNIRGSFHDDGDNDWNKRRNLNINTIKLYQPDILGIQEAQSGNLAHYEMELPEYALELGPVSVRKAANYHHVPIYWQKDRYKLIDKGGFYLSDTPERWSIGWDATFPRAATWVILHDLETCKEFCVLNTHFPHEQDKHETRSRCAELIVQKLTSISGSKPVIVMADFNALPGSTAYQTFTNAGFVDSYRTLHQTDVNTFHGFKGKDSNYQGLRLDWILINGTLVTKGAKVIMDAVPPLYPSDHYPVLADVDFT